MRKALFLLSFLLLLPFQNTFALFKQVHGIEDTNIKRVAVSDLNPSLIYVASQNSLYKSENGGKTFDKVAVLGQQRWAFNYVTDDEYAITTFYNLSPVFYWLEMANLSSAYQIRQKVRNLIDSTKI